MNKFVKYTVVSLLLLFCSLQAFAAENIDTIIKKSPLNNTSTIAVSVRNAKTGRVVYQYNQNKLLNPASALKVFTMKPVFDVLGADYKFQTGLYKDGANNIYIKLAGDPSLTTGRLADLLKNNEGEVKDIIIDPYATDYQEWGIGWMWDDDASHYFPKYSPFTINNNMIKADIIPGSKTSLPQLKNRSGYSMVLVNMLTNGDADDFTVSRQPWLSSDTTVFSGTVNKESSVMLPVDNTQRYFVTCLKDALSKAGVKYTGTIKTAPVPQNLEQLAKTESEPLSSLLSTTLKNSNNLYAELLFKAGGAKFAKAQGTTNNGIKLFDNSYASINAKKPLIYDGCGVSRNDLVSADWMSEALSKIYNDKNFSEYEVLLPKPIEGTLSDRLINISRFVRAKTGTISGASSLAGYVTSKSGTKYSFAIIIQHFDGPVSAAKALEDQIVNAVYKY